MADDFKITGEEFNIDLASTEAPVTNADLNSEESIMNVDPNNISMPSENIQISDNAKLPNEVNFNQAYPDMSGFDVETFDSAINFATEGMPNLEINQPFKDMIDAAAVDLDKYPSSIAPNNDLNSIYPGRAGSDFNPFRQSSGIPDLNTANGRKAFMSQTQDIAMDRSPNKTPGYKDPLYYGAKRYEMDRYYRHPRFADLGFHPFANNEEIYQTNSSKWDNFTRTRGQWSAMWGPAFTSGWRSIGDAISGDVFRSDMIGAQSMDDAMRIGRSGSGGTRGFMNDLFLNSSYTVGIISSIALEELALFGIAAAQGGLNPVADAALVARTGMNIGKAGRAVRSLFKMKTYSSAGANMLFKLQQINTAKRFWAASRAGGRSLGNSMGRFLAPETLYQMKKIKSAAKAGDNMTQMAKGAAYFGGFYRDIRAVNAAWSESKMEAGLKEMEERDQHYMDVKASKNGVDPSMEEMEVIAGLAKGAAIKSTLINMPIIYLSNKLVLDGAMRGFKPLGRMMDESLSGPMGRILRNPKSVKKHFYDVGAGNKVLNALGLDIFRKMYKAGATRSFKHLGSTGLRYGTANLAEGFQELAQEATGAGITAYYKGIYAQELGTSMDVQLAEITEAYHSGEQSFFGDFKVNDNMNKAVSIREAVSRGVGSQISGQGLHTFMSGFLMGGMVQGPQKILFEGAPNLMRMAKDKVQGTTEMSNFKTQREEYITKTVDILNKVYQDPNLYFDPKRINALTQKELNTRMMGSSYADNILEHINDKDHAIFSAIHTVLQSGQLNAFRDQMTAIQSMDNQTIKEAFSDVNSTPQKLRARAGDMLNRMDEVEKTYNALKDEYVNPFNSNKFKKGTRQHTEEALRSIAYESAKMMAMFSKDTFEQSLKRSNEIYQSLSSDPVLAEASAGDIAALTTLKGMLTELDLLKEDVKIETDPKRKKIKEKKLELLQNYFDIFTATENQTSRNGLVIRDEDGKIINEAGVYDRRKIGKLKPAFEKYLKFIAEQNDDFIFSADIENTLKKIVDYGFLKGRAQDYFKAMENLMNPDNMLELAERMSLIMKGVWEEHKDKNNQLIRLEKYVDQQMSIEFLRALSEKGIQPEAEQTKKFLEDGTIPSEYFDENGVITPQSDPTGWQIIENLQKNLRQMQGEKKAETFQDDTSETNLDDTEEDLRSDGDSGGNIIIPSEDSNDPIAKMERQAARLAALQTFLDSNTNTAKLLKDKYDQYKEGWALNGVGSLLLYPQWLRSKDGGAGILRSRFEMFNMYEAEDSSVKDQKTFEQWVDANSRNPLLVGPNGILTKNGIKHSDVSLLKSEEDGPQIDKFDSNEKIINPKSKSEIYVVETTVTEKDGSKSIFYTLRDKNGNDVSEKYASLDSKELIQKAYINKTDALKALKFIENNLPKKTKFSFAGIDFTTGDIVEDSSGKKWMIRTTEGMLKNNNNLYLVPIDKKNSKKGEDDRIYKTEEQWKNEGWKKALAEKSDLSANNLTRLRVEEPVKFYPYQGKKVKPGSKFYDQGQNDNRTPEQAAEDWQKFLRELSPLEIINLRVVVEKNPTYNTVQEEIQNGNFKPSRTAPGYENNPGLAQGANEFDVTLMMGNKPVGKLVGMDATILRDIDGSLIDGSKITQEQAERLFITYNDKNAAASIRKRYAYAQLINQAFRGKLGKNTTGTFNLTDFPAIKFMISSGNLTGFKTSTPWEDLNYNTLNGNVFIYDVRTVYDKEGNPTIQTNIITDVDTTTPEGELRAINNRDEVDQALASYVKNGENVETIEQLKMGRYVAAIKLPNGTITFVQLTSDKLETEQLNDILFGTEGVLNQMQKTLDENFKDGKLKIEKDNYDPSQYNNEYNENLENQFYVSLKPGEYLNIGVTKYGKLSVYYTNRITGENYKMTLSKEIMEGVNTIESFVETINANWAADQKTELGKAKKNKTEYKEIKLQLTKDSFVNNIPETISSPESLIGLVLAKSKPEIRENINAQFVWTNSADLQASTSTSSFTISPTTPYGTKDGPEVKGPEIDPMSQPLTDQIFQELLNTEFNIIPEEILNSIRNKVLSQGRENLTEQEELVVQAYENKDIGPFLQESDIASSDAAIKKNKDGSQAESNNETIIAEINRKTQELKDAKKEFADKRKADLADSGMTKAAINKQIKKERDNDERLIELGNQIEKLNNSLGYKIVDNFDGQDVEDIDTFIEWARENLPDFIQIEDIEDLGRRLKNNGITAGAFAIELGKLTGGMDIVGKIYTGKLNPFKYHEAFHAVFRMLLSESEIKKYLRIAKQEKLAELKKEGKTLVQALSELKELSPVYQRMGRQELEDTLYEEYLSDRFEEFKMNPRSANTSSEVKSLFTRILEWIKNLFLSYSPNELNLLFSKIDTGKYRSVEIASNRFTSSDFVNSEILDNKSGITNVAMKAIPMSRSIQYRPNVVNGVIQEKGKQIEVIKYFSQKDQNAMIGTIGAMYLNNTRALGQSEDFNGEYNPDKLLRDTLDEYIERYNPDREDDFYAERDDFLDIEEELTEFYEALKGNDNEPGAFEDVFKAVKEYLTLFDVQVENQIEELEQEDFTAEGIVKAAEEWDSQANQIGGFKSLSAEIRKFIATTTVRKTDRFGVEYDEPVNYVDAYNGLLKSLKNTNNPKDMIAKMEIFGQSNENTAAVVDRIYDEIGIGTLSSSDLLSGNYNINEVSNPLFFQSIIKGFTQFRLDYIFAENDPLKGITNLYAANHKDDANSQTDVWSNTYALLFPEISKNKRKRTEIEVFLNGFQKSLNQGEDSSMTDKDLLTRANTLSVRLQDLLGINLSPGYIQYSIISNLDNLTAEQRAIKIAYSEAEPVEAKDIEEIGFSISAHTFNNGVYGANLFLNFDVDVVDNDITEDNSDSIAAETGDTKNRIKKMARGNAVFDESVGNTVFLDPKGNLIYAHQQPTMHLEKIAELNSEDAITNLQATDVFLETNYLLNDPKFKALVNQGKLRISRIIGSKMVNLNVDADGNFKTNNSLDLSRRPGVSFGDSSPSEFISNLINSYLVDYNAATGKIKTTNYQTTDEFGNEKFQDFASAIVDIKVIAESNTGDFISLPIVKAVEKTDGEVKITEEYLNKILNEVETEYNKISREVNKTKGFTEEVVDNYNTFTSIEKINDDNPRTDKAAKLFKTGELLIKRKKQVIALNRLNVKLTAIELKAIKGKTSILLKAGTWGAKAGLVEGVQSVFEIDGVDYTIVNKGNQNISDNNLDTIKKQLGLDISDSKSTIHKWEVKINDGVIGYTRTMDQRDFLLGKINKNIIEIKVSETSLVLASTSELESQLEKVLNDEDYEKASKIKDEIKSRSGEVDVFETDNTAKRLLEDFARAGVPFSEALKNIKDFGVNIKELLNERLNQEFKEFDSLLNNIRAKSKISKGLSEELKTSKNKVTSETKKSMGLLNLKPNEATHNLMQWFFNDYLNTMSINQILLGDVSMTIKDAVDEVKRAKMQNAAGPSAASIISAKEYGVMHPVKHISTVTFRDSIFQKKFSKSGGTGEKTDAQMYMTTKAFRYMMFGFGSLSTAQAKILNRIEAGENITWQEFFGNAKQGTEGFKKLNAILNSKKLVYADGKTFIKMSAIVLTPQLTTDPLTGLALPHRVELHNMRIKLEKIESEGNETIGIAVPESASKMLRANVIETEDMFNSNSVNPNNVTNLDARWMRLQQIVPSNKIETVDPGQIKQLITSEQSDDVEVTIGGVEMTVGDVRELYNKTVGERVTLKYLNKRNLTFNFANYQNELQKSIDTGKVTVDLQAFLEYAKTGLESSQAKSQFLELFEVDETGTPKYDLNNPITLQKFQELFMSYFSKNVLRERQPGHAVALVSDKGMRVIKKVVALDAETGQPSRWDIIRTEDWKALRNKPKINFDRFTDLEARTFSGIKIGDIYIDELRSNVIEYDSNGEPTGQRYSEFMLPAHFAEIMQNLKPGQPIPDVISKAFATRIPSQDKHSSVNLKLVDFLPVFYGSSGVFPEELIEISGADFDIDKLYMQIKEFYMKDGEFVEYGKSNNVDTMFDEYKDYQKKAANKKGTSVNEAVSIFRKRGSILDQQDLKNRNKRDGAAKIIDSDLIGALRLLSLPVTKEEFIEYIGKYNEKLNSWDRMPYEGAQNNKVLDQRFALLGNDGMTGPLFKRDYGISQEPAVLDPLTTVWDFIQEELPVLAEKVNEEGVIVDNALGKLKAWTNNKAGARSIGAVVLPNIVMNLLKENKVKIIDKNKDGIPVMKISINGHPYDTFDVNYEIDPKTGKQIKNGTRTQFVISALVTAMTDNAKERLAAKLGLNKDALAVVTNLVALGVGVRTAILMVNNPELKKLYYLAENKDDPMDPGIKSLVRGSLEAAQLADPEVYNMASVTEVTDKSMINLIKMDGKLSSEQDRVDQIALLMLFQQAHKLKETTSKIQSLVTLISGIGRDTESIDKKQEDIDDLGIELSTEKFNKTIVPIDVRKVFRGKSLQSTYYKIWKEFRDLTPTVFVTRTEPFTKLTNLITSNLNSRSIDTKFKQKVEKDILSYLTGKAYIQSLLQSGQGNLVVSLSNGLVYDEFTQNNMSIDKVLIRVREYLKSQNKENFFVQKQLAIKSTKNGANKTGINQVQLNTWSRLADSQLIDMQNSMVDLYQDINTRADAYHLMHYLLVKDGLQYGSNSFMSAMPAPLLEQILGSSARVHNLFKDKSATNQDYSRVFGEGVTFNNLAQDMVDGYLSSRSNAYYLPQIFKGQYNKPSIIAGSDEVQDEVETTEQTSGVIVNTKKWNKDSPKENPDTAYVFTENINSIDGGIQGSGSAVIRNNPNAIGIITKKYYFYDDKGNRKGDRTRPEALEVRAAYKGEGQWYNQNFQDTDSDFELFKKLNLEQFVKLDEFDSKIFPDSFANSLAAIPNKFALWLQNELKTRYDLTTNLNKKGTGLISVGGVKVSKAKESKIKKVSGNTIVLDENSKTITADLMASVGVPVDKKKYKGKKGRFSRKSKFLKTQDKIKKLNSNAKFLKSRGFNVVDRLYKNNTIKLVQFPLVVSFSKKEKNPETGKMEFTYRYFKLTQLFTPLTEIDQNDLYNMNESQSVGLGNKAVYEEIEMLGSLDQNAMAGVYGPRTTYNVLEASIQAQQPLTAIDRIAGQAVKAVEAMAEKMAGTNIAEKHFGSKITIKANENKIDVENSEGKAVNLSKVQEMSENNEDMHTGEEIVVPEGKGVNISKFNKMMAMNEESSVPGEFKMVTDFYNDLTRFQKAQIAKSFSKGGLEIGSIEDIIKDLNDNNNQYTEEEYIDHMKECYK